MLNTVKAVSEFHDIEVQYWSDAVREKCLKNEMMYVSKCMKMMGY